MADTRQEVEHPQNPNEVECLRDCPGLYPFYRSFGHAGLKGQFRLGQPQRNPPLPQSPAELFKNRVISHFFKFCHSRHFWRNKIIYPYISSKMTNCKLFIKSSKMTNKNYILLYIVKNDE